MIQAAWLSSEGWVASSEVAGDVLAVQRGDRDAFASLMARFQNRLYRYLLRWVRNHATAEDLFQQTWMRIIANIHRFDTRRSFEPWLFAIARNLVMDHLRRRQPGSLEEPAAEGRPLSDTISTSAPGALEQLLHSERAERIQQALESQPPVFREILTLRFEEEMKLEEIAEVLSIPLGTVKSRLGRALEHLRTELLRQNPEESAP
jgi:RNA polymerase sigma-70 factor (ECF subfamily)